MKVCSKCGVEKPFEDFHKGRGECKACGLLQHKAWRDRKNAEGNEFRKKTLDNHYKWKSKMSTEELEEFRRIATERSLERNRRIKAAVYEAYGGYRCACCGETEPMFLSIDHINNDGYERRKNGEGHGASFYGRLFMIFKRTGVWPSDVQVLCMNCQHGKARNGGICPHKQGVTTIP